MKLCELRISAKIESFIMSYNYNGSQIHVAHPVQSISVNKQCVIFADKYGQTKSSFKNATDARRFLNWLINS